MCVHIVLFQLFHTFVRGPIISYLQQPRKPVSVGLAVQSGATVLPKEGKCKSSCIHLKLEPYICYSAYIIHFDPDSLESPSVGRWLIFKVSLLSTPCSSSQGGAMAGEVACLSSMTQGKVSTGCIFAESNPEINDHKTGSCKLRQLCERTRCSLCSFRGHCCTAAWTSSPAGRTLGSTDTGMHWRPCRELCSSVQVFVAKYTCVALLWGKWIMEWWRWRTVFWPRGQRMKG